MEYLEDHGVYADIPVDTIVMAWKKAYGKTRVEGWIRHFKSKEYVQRNFFNETVVKM